jgi:hypothetical protein
VVAIEVCSIYIDIYIVEGIMGVSSFHFHFHVMGFVDSGT